MGRDDGGLAGQLGRRAGVAVAIVPQGGVLGGRAKFPGVVQAAVVVQVQIPAVIEVGAGGAVVGGRAQLVGFEAGVGGQPAAGGPAGADGVPVTVRYPSAERVIEIADQPAGIVCRGVGVIDGFPHGVAVSDGARVVAHQSADSPERRLRPAGFGAHRHIGVADGDGAGVVAHQSAGIAVALYRAALGVAGGDPGGGLGVAHEGAQSGAAGAGDGRVNQSDLLNVAGAGAEQPQGILAGSADDGQVGDGVTVAVEPAGVGRNSDRLVQKAERVHVAGVHAADGRPAGAAVVVSVIGAVVGRAGVKVQVGAQLVAGAAGGRAAHVRLRAPEGGGVVVVVVGLVGDAVAVQIPADGVELGQVADFNQAVVLVVVVLRRQGHGDGVGAVLGAGLRGAVLRPDGDGDGVAAGDQLHLVAGLVAAGVGGGDDHIGHADAGRSGHGEVANGDVGQPSGVGCDAVGENAVEGNAGDGEGGQAGHAGEGRLVAELGGGVLPVRL